MLVTCSDCRVCILSLISDCLLIGYRCVVKVNVLLQLNHLLVTRIISLPLSNTLLERRM